MILVGLIPGPQEPKHDINSYISPLTDELIEFWKGLNIPIHSSCKKIVRCGLLCFTCDLPAGRKLCGFLGFSARYGCSRCFKAFPGHVGLMDYSGFNRDEWPPRCGRSHRQVACSLKNFTTKSEQATKESNAGCRYSELLRLPYFDAPHMLVVDPMHCLFLGTDKYYLKRIWIENAIISNSDFDVIQQSVDSTIAPAGIGRIPCKINSGFSSFTADQWKNWVNYFSLLSLQGRLHGNDLECWRHFVLACRILTKRKLSTNDIHLADGLIMHFPEELNASMVKIGLHQTCICSVTYDHVLKIMVHYMDFGFLHLNVITVF